MEVLSVRVPREIRKWLEELAKLEGKDKAEIAREILAKGVRERRLEAALSLYRQGKATLWKAAELAGLSLWEIIDEGKTRNRTQVRPQRAGRRLKGGAERRP